MLCSERQSKSDREQTICPVPKLFCSLKLGTSDTKANVLPYNQTESSLGSYLSRQDLHCCALKSNQNPIESSRSSVVGIPYVRYQNSDNATHFEQVWSGLFNSGNEWNSLSPPFNFPKSQFPVLPR